MTYRVLYGDDLTVAARNCGYGGRARSEQFSTEHEALSRARELLQQDERHAVAICDPAGNLVGGVCLQLKLGYCGD